MTLKLVLASMVIITLKFHTGLGLLRVTEYKRYYIDSLNKTIFDDVDCSSVACNNGSLSCAATCRYVMKIVNSISTLLLLISVLKRIFNIRIRAVSGKVAPLKGYLLA